MTYVRKFPVSIPDISQLASLFADKTRAAICGILMSGTAWTVTELANFCKISKSNATEQINKLIDGGILTYHRQGRHKYVMIASKEIAELIERLAQVSGQMPESPQSLNAGRYNELFRKGRSCYGHLAGEIGVTLLQGLRCRGYLSDQYRLTKAGIALLKEWGIANPQKLEGKACMDTTRRTFHLAGSLGRELCKFFLEEGWLIRDKEKRLLSLSEKGYRNFRRYHIIL